MGWIPDLAVLSGVAPLWSQGLGAYISGRGFSRRCAEWRDSHTLRISTRSAWKYTKLQTSSSHNLLSLIRGTTNKFPQLLSPYSPTSAAGKKLPPVAGHAGVRGFVSGACGPVGRVVELRGRGEDAESSSSGEQLRWFPRGELQSSGTRHLPWPLSVRGGRAAAPGGLLGPGAPGDTEQPERVHILPVSYCFFMIIIFVCCVRVHTCYGRGGNQNTCLFCACQVALAAKKS